MTKAKARGVSLILLVLAILSTVFLISTGGAGMSKVFIVQVSDSKKTVFPQVCVVCQDLGIEPLIPFTIKDEEVEFDFYLYRRMRSNPDTPPDHSFLDIPAHHTCLRKFQYTLLTRLFFILMVAAAVAVICVLNKIGIFFSLIASLIVMAPLLALEWGKPSPVEFHHYAHKYVLFFKDRHYAEEFARLNNASVQEGDYPFDFHRRL
jgi:hypothetical protein